MLVGADKITETADKLLTNIIANNDEDELVEIEEVFVIAVAHNGDPDEDHTTATMFYRCTSGKYYIQRGIIAHLGDIIKDNRIQELGE